MAAAVDARRARPRGTTPHDAAGRAVPEKELSDGMGQKKGLSGFPNAETLNLTMSYVDVGLIGHRVQTRKGPV